MNFIDEATRDDLAKSSTILQCILALLEFECSKDHIQPEVIGVEQEIAMLCVDPMGLTRMTDVCMAVNKQFIRKDGKYTCYVEKEAEGLICCEALKLDQYIQLA